ncbi:MAG TPA: hypothetical protein VGF25_16705 [Thermoleophilaceae bacterium]
MPGTRPPTMLAAMITPARTCIALLLLSLALAADASAAGGGVIGGKLPGLSQLPAKGRLVAVRAVDTGTGTVAAGARPRAASYSLRVPAGRYMVFGSATSTRGGRALAFGSRSVRVRKGRRSAAKVRAYSKRKKQRRHRRKRRHARSSAATLPAIGVSPGTVLRGVPGYPDGLPLDSLVITDYFGAEPCAGGRPPLVEVRDRQRILDEIERQQSELFDPRHRIEPHLIEPDAMISGSGTVTAGQVRLTLQIAGSVEASVSGSAAFTADGLAGLVDSLVEQLMQEVCDELDPPTPPAPPASPPAEDPTPLPTPAGRPAAYVGSAQGSQTSYDGIGGALTHSWSADDLRYELFTGNASTNGYYLLAGGSVHVTVSGSFSQCQWTGSGTVSLGQGTGSQGMLDLNLPDDNYFVTGRAMGYITATVDCPQDPPTQYQEPVGMEFLRSDPGSAHRLPGPGGVLSGSAGLTETQQSTQWSWSLHPHS